MRTNKQRIARRQFEECIRDGNFKGAVNLAKTQLGPIEVQIAVFANIAHIKDRLDLMRTVLAAPDSCAHCCDVAEKETAALGQQLRDIAWSYNLHPAVFAEFVGIRLLQAGGIHQRILNTNPSPAN